MTFDEHDVQLGSDERAPSPVPYEKISIGSGEGFFAVL